MPVMRCEEAKLHEVSRKHYSKVAATFFKHPEFFKYEGDRKWLCKICKTGGMTVKNAKAHEIQCQEEGAENGEAESRTVFERNDDDDDEDDDDDDNEGEGNEEEYEEGYEEEEDDDNDNDDDDNDNDNNAFVENFLRRHSIDANRGEMLRSFYKMPTDLKIQKIQEVIRDFRRLMLANEGI
ncbi:hypothetical protein EI94DRAFT_1715188 [Lactarius quietus]|nr:hypothetical protein EI94DRAFT_1715188 [Lactarius quietus]